MPVTGILLTLRVTCIDVVQITSVLFIDFRKKSSKLLQGRCTASVGNYGCRSALRRRKQLKADKHVSCLCLQMRQTSSDDFNCVSLLHIVKCINPRVVLKYDNSARYGNFCVMCVDGRKGREGLNVPGNDNNEKQIRVFPFSCLVPPTLLYPSVTLHSISLEQLSLQWGLGIGKCQFDDSFH